MLNLFRKEKRQTAEIVLKLYGAIVAQARHAQFYRTGGVKDDVNGRFDMILLHMWLAGRRLRGATSVATERSQQIFDLFVTDMDRSVRELGTSDRRVPKKVKQLVAAYYGRMTGYDEALDSDDPDALAGAIARNIFAEQADARRLARPLAGYARRAHKVLADQPLDDIVAGFIIFPEPELPDSVQDGEDD